MHRTTQPHRLHIASPGVDGLILRLVHEVIVDHRTEVHDKPCVTALRQSIFQVQGRAVLVTAHLDIAVGDATVTGHLRIRRNKALRQERQSLSRLEGRARRLGFANGLTHIRPLWRVRRQTDNIAVFGVDGHDTARLSFQQTFTQLLKYGSDSQRPIRRQSLCLGCQAHERQR